MSNFMKIRPVGVEMFHADWLRDMRQFNILKHVKQIYVKLEEEYYPEETEHLLHPRI